MRENKVFLSVPAKPDYILAVRLLVSAVAQRADFSLDEIEDMKVASAEACTLLLAENPQEIEVTITTHDSFCVSFCAKEAAGSSSEEEQVSELSQYLLEALVDRCELERSGDVLTNIIIYKD